MISKALFLTCLLAMTSMVAAETCTVAAEATEAVSPFSVLNTRSADVTDTTFSFTVCCDEDSCPPVEEIVIRTAAGAEIELPEGGEVVDTCAEPLGSGVAFSDVGALATGSAACETFYISTKSNEDSTPKELSAVCEGACVYVIKTSDSAIAGTIGNDVKVDEVEETPEEPEQPITKPSPTPYRRRRNAA